MIEKLDSKMDCVEITVLGKHTECLGFDSAKEIGKKLNELIDAVNGILDYAPLEMAMKAEKPNIDIGELAYLQKENSNLKDELERTRKALGQSEICCAEWEKQALDYKAENIALSGDLERTRKALDVAKDTIRHADWFFDGDYNVYTKDMHNEIKCALEQITALEQKE